VVSVVIDQNGFITQSKVIRSVNQRLDQAALDAVAEWRYQPATLDGFPVAVYGIIELSFQLDGG
jgi:protein TonB